MSEKMEWQRIGKISVWAYLWRSLVFGGVVVLMFFAEPLFSNGGMLDGLAVGFSRGCSLVLFLLLVIASRLGMFLETDGAVLYLVRVSYFKRTVFKEINIKDIAKIVFKGNTTMEVIIYSNDVKDFLTVKKNDEMYKYLFNLTIVHDIDRQVEIVKGNNILFKVVLWLVVIASLYFHYEYVLATLILIGLLIPF